MASEAPFEAILLFPISNISFNFMTLVGQKEPITLSCFCNCSSFVVVHYWGQYETGNVPKMNMIIWNPMRPCGTKQRILEIIINHIQFYRKKKILNTLFYRIAQPSTITPCYCRPLPTYQTIFITNSTLLLSGRWEPLFIALKL